MLIKLRKLKDQGFTVDFSEKKGELSIFAGNASQETIEQFNELCTSLDFEPPEIEQLLCMVDEMICIKGIRRAH